MAITLTQAQAQLDAYLAASLAVATHQSYTIAGRVLVLADLEFINRSIEMWDARVASLTRGGVRVRGGGMGGSF